MENGNFDQEKLGEAIVKVLQRNIKYSDVYDDDSFDFIIGSSHLDYAGGDTDMDERRLSLANRIKEEIFDELSQKVYIVVCSDNKEFLVHADSSKIAETIVKNKGYEVYYSEEYPMRKNILKEIK